MIARDRSLASMRHETGRDAPKQPAA